MTAKRRTCSIWRMTVCFSTWSGSAAAWQASQTGAKVLVLVDQGMLQGNPKLLERVAALEGFAGLHPFLPQLRYGGMLAQGALQVLYDLERID